MFFILSQDPSAPSAWGPTSTLGTPVGQWVEGLETEAAARKQLQCSACSPYHHHPAPLPANCRAAKCQLPPRPQVAASQWIGGSLESLRVLLQPHRRSCAGMVSIGLSSPLTLRRGLKRGKHEDFFGSPFAQASPTSERSSLAALWPTQPRLPTVGQVKSHSTYWPIRSFSLALQHIPQWPWPQAPIAVE